MEYVESIDNFLFLLFDEYKSIKPKQEYIINCCDIYIGNIRKQIFKFEDQYKNFEQTSKDIQIEINNCVNILNDLTSLISTKQKWDKLDSINGNDTRKKIKIQTKGLSLKIKQLLKIIRSNIKQLQSCITNTKLKMDEELLSIISFYNHKDNLLEDISDSLLKTEDLKKEFYKRVVGEIDSKSSWHAIVKKIVNHDILFSLVNEIKNFISYIQSLYQKCHTFKDIMSQNNYNRIHKDLKNILIHLNRISINKKLNYLRNKLDEYKKNKEKDFLFYEEHKKMYISEKLSQLELKTKTEIISKNYIEHLPYRIEEIYKEIELINWIEKPLITKVEKTIKSILTIINIPDNFIILKTIKYKMHDTRIYTHLFNVCIYSIIIGIKAGFLEKELFELGLCALFHDIGFVELKNKYINLSKEYYKDNEDNPNYNSHPIFSIKVLNDKLKIKEYFSKDMINSIVMHHLYIDGTGYPEKAVELYCNSGKTIPKYGKIIRIADEFDLLTLRNDKLKAKAYKILSQSNHKNKFDSDYLHYFLNDILHTI